MTTRSQTRAAHRASVPPSAVELMCTQVQMALADVKAVEVQALDVRALTDITDFMVLATGTSPRHIKTIRARVLEWMRPQYGAPLGSEGEVECDWVVVDYVDVVVHIMRAPTRIHYDLEGLWHPSLAVDA